MGVTGGLSGTGRGPAGVSWRLAPWTKQSFPTQCSSLCSEIDFTLAGLETLAKVFDPPASPRSPIREQVSPPLPQSAGPGQRASLEASARLCLRGWRGKLVMGDFIVWVWFSCISSPIEGTMLLSWSEAQPAACVHEPSAGAQIQREFRCSRLDASVKVGNCNAGTWERENT